MQVAIFGDVLTSDMQFDRVQRMIQRSALDHWQRERTKTMEKGVEIRNKPVIDRIG